MHFDLEGHLKREHHRTAFSTYLKEIVYGGNDIVDVCREPAYGRKRSLSIAVPIVPFFFRPGNLLPTDCR
jgi:hypothetical protein